jgi:soluble lytic murein transglycosylase-like protein
MVSSRRCGLILLVAAAAVAAATSAEAQVRRAPQREAARASSRHHGAYAREIAEASARYAVPERLIWAVIRVESGFDHRAVSPKGARGLMQLMPETAAMLGVRDPFDPRQNIHAGTRHLRAMMERFRHDVRLAVAAYNAGERPVAQYRGVPPYRETRQYVTQVLHFYGAPSARVERRQDGIRRIVEPNGSVIYTNIAFGGFSALSP